MRKKRLNTLQAKNFSSNQLFPLINSKTINPRITNENSESTISSSIKLNIKPTDKSNFLRRFPSNTNNNINTFYKNDKEKKNNLMPDKTKTLLFFRKELKQLEEEQKRMQSEAEKENKKNERSEGRGECVLERSKTAIELGNLPYTPTFACQLNKRQRFEIYKRRLNIKKAAKTAEEAIELINKTMDEIEDKYAPKKDNKQYPIYSKAYGRMFPIPKDRIRLNEETNMWELLTVGMIIYVKKNGSFEMWSFPRGLFESKKLFFKNGAV